MSQHYRKLVGSVAILVFLAIYIGVAIVVAEIVPPFWAAKLAYFLFVGTAWGAPLIPLISWMNRGR